MRMLQSGKEDTLFAKVIIDIAHGAVDRAFTYHVPEALPLLPGHHVTLPFGNGNKTTEGFVLSLMEKSDLKEDITCKDVLAILEPYPVLTPEQIALSFWMKETYNCLLIDALRLMIPSQLRGGRVKEKHERIVRIRADADIWGYFTKSRSPLQKEVLALLEKTGQPMSLKDISAMIPKSGAAISALLKKGILEEDSFTVFRRPGYGLLEEKRPALTEEQARVLEGFRAMNSGCIALLRGVTGSGKTEVYLRCIEDCLEKGEGAIILVPEIALTPQTVGRFAARFGDRIAVLHSRLSPGERFDEWRRIRLGKAPIVIGARSAVFAPVENLRLILIDEEHESSYQSETAPRYHALDVARKRMSVLGGKILLGSATPSLLSYYRALNGSYTLLELPHRVLNRPLPQVLLQDMREEFLMGNNGIFSQKLLSLLDTCLRQGHQAMLFINRRGYSTFVSCRSCGYVLRCSNCDISMTYHKSENRVRCHYCGAVQPLPHECPNCHKPFIKYFGIGTEQVEEQVMQHFPGVRCLRMDTDTVRTKNSYEEILSAFRRGEARVLIGTQMIAKGHDFPNVTLVGVVSADTTLNYPDYRSAERTFHLLTQVAGRAGRDKEPGKVVLQTYTPQHPILAFASQHDFVGFYQYEIAQRKKNLYPPFSLFLRVILQDSEEEPLNKRGKAYAIKLEKVIREALGTDGQQNLLLLYASPAPIARIAGQYRYQVLAKILRTKRLPEVLRAIYAFENEYHEEGLGRIEINPQDMY